MSAIALPAGMPADPNRALIACVVASIALHAAVLFVGPSLREAPPAPSAPKVLTAFLAPSLAMPQAKVAPQPEPPQPQPVPPRPELKPKAETPKEVLTRPTPAPEAPRVAAKPVAEPAPVAPPVQAAPVAPAAPAAPAPPVAAPSAPVPQAPAASASDGSRPSPGGDDAGSLSQYRMALIGAANKYKRYPAQAMERGWTGKVVIRMAIGANGMTQNTTVVSSSGHDLLDNTALDMVRKGKPLAQIPAALRGREFTVDVPVIFDLQSG
jgi:protein TonB